MRRRQAERLTERVAALARSRAYLVEAADFDRRRSSGTCTRACSNGSSPLALHLGMTGAPLIGESPEIREVLVAAHDEATAAPAEPRNVVRGLLPAVLNDRGGGAALCGVAAWAPLLVELRVNSSNSTCRHRHRPPPPDGRAQIPRHPRLRPTASLG